MITQEIIEFIKRRFKQDCDWKTGNCYYFAIILSERFNKYNPTIYYDILNGHFICKINNIFYDWSGTVVFNDEYANKYVKKWSDLYNEDSVWGDRIIRDVIL